MGERKEQQEGERERKKENKIRLHNIPSASFNNYYMI
jgi:hypothetical protein